MRFSCPFCPAKVFPADAVAHAAQHDEERFAEALDFVRNLPSELRVRLVQCICLSCGVMRRDPGAAFDEHRPSCVLRTLIEEDPKKR